VVVTVVVRVVVRVGVDVAVIVTVCVRVVKGVGVSVGVPVVVSAGVSDWVPVGVRVLGGIGVIGVDTKARLWYSPAAIAVTPFTHVGTVPCPLPSSPQATAVPSLSNARL
jgi:hypothetical protein